MAKAKKINQGKIVKTEARHTQSVDDSKLYAFLAYLLSIVGFLIVLLTKKDDKFAMYHAKQSLVLFFVWVIASVIGWIPFIGQIISVILIIGCVILWIIGMLNALQGKEVPLPIIGEFGEKIKL